MAGLLVPHLRPVEAGNKQADGPTSKYVGAAGCKFCHQGRAGGQIYEGWQATDHAKAFEHLSEADRDNDQCLACHTTGFGEPIAAGVAAASLQGVQCEACHGPGSEYKKISIMKDRHLAMSLGLVAPSEAVCRSCHTASLPKECWAGTDAQPRFDFKSAYEKIEHHIPEKSRR